MALLPDIKCPRCDRTYSGFRARCPYCGARRNVKSKREADDGSMWRAAVAILLLAILFVAVVVLIVGASRDKKEADAMASASAFLQEQQAQLQAQATPTVPPLTPSPTPTIEVVPIEAVEMHLYGEEVGLVDSDEYDYDITMTVGETLDFEAYVIPATSMDQLKLEWSSSDKEVVNVSQTGEWTAVGSGECVITLKTGAVFCKAFVRVYD